MPSTESNNKKPSTPNRGILYAEAAKYAPRAIEVLAEIMEKADSDNARMGAAKTILAKSIPDLKAMEITGNNGQPIQLLVNVGNGFVPTTVRLPASPVGSITEGQSQI